MAAAVNVSQGMALHQTHRGVALRDRLPRVAALFEAGLVSNLLVRAIVWRTYLITDEEAMAAVDAALAERITGWGALSVAKTEDAIDELVDEHDPGALRRSRESASSRTVEFGSPSDVAGTTSMWARLNSPDAALIEQSVEELARSVCDADPRTIDERRADALMAAVKATALTCGCGEPDCPGGQRPVPSKNTIVYVVAEKDTVEAVDAATPAAEGVEPRRCSAPPAFVLGAGVMPAPLLAGIMQGATIREVRHPGAATSPEPRYAPSSTDVRVCALPGLDVPVPRLRQSGAVLRHRPHHAVSGRSDAPVKPEVPVPFSSLAQNVLRRDPR
jgi:hypothetical protein